ncbi:MAG: hypothetical protein ACOZAO_02390 [Patescibacteria group bacterium]
MQKGFTPLIIVLLITLVLGTLVLLYKLLPNAHTTPEVNNTIVFKETPPEPLKQELLEFKASDFKFPSEKINSISSVESCGTGCHSKYAVEIVDGIITKTNSSRVASNETKNNYTCTINEDALNKLNLLFNQASADIKMSESDVSLSCYQGGFGKCFDLAIGEDQYKFYVDAQSNLTSFSCFDPSKCKSAEGYLYTYDENGRIKYRSYAFENFEFGEFIQDLIMGAGEDANNYCISDSVKLDIVQ